MESNCGKFVANSLDLPLFMASRVRFRKTFEQNTIRDYIGQKKELYLSEHGYGKNQDKNTFIFRKYHYIFSENEKNRFPPECSTKPKGSISLGKEKSWQLPPNRYRQDYQPFANKAGLKGAYWRKLPTTKPLKRISKKPKYHLYDLPKESEKMVTPCHCHKGQFLSNARDKRATTRCMIANPLTAYKDPMEPAPNTYDPKAPGKTYEPRGTSFQALNPHIFYRKSIVPLKPNSIHPPNISFLPGPGRYETRYRNLCPCPSSRKYLPDLELMVEREKRHKFRRMPYTKLKTQFYCSPDWRHVAGGGFRRLFRTATGPQKRQVVAEDIAKGKAKLVKLFHDVKYINMILDPPHNLGSLRSEPLPQLPTRIKFDRMVKVITRKQLRTNRKLAFGSSSDRWKEDEQRQLPLTAQQVKELKEKLPPERRLHNKPIMMKKPDEIQSQLLKTPLHMLPNYVPKLRKRLFKFSPLPGAKILTDDADIRPGEPSKHGYYFRPLNEKLFFKDDK
ncbi:uncharacterized protein LOC133326793 [Musca vetustissima]|uniref:uncharacterized protein LOC133326793 n=1 Tax=Musca vetustissima TaxID=27455 RepID=UPI002AB5FF88|nr:uncharacterized protein LOC133326793 [Musca vetustissima]